ncbi:MAG: chromate resistance protein [Magnetococcales bacterium]|nr:chromate resistance protein [Magnetococcales bacterium]
MPSASIPFVALIFSLPARNATERMRTWRALKSMGGAMLRDGLYLLPAREAQETMLTEVAEAIRTAGGMAEVVGLQPRSDTQHAGLRALFDRQEDYLALHDTITGIDPERLEASALKRAARLARRRFQELSAIDFFPNATQTRVLSSLTALEDRLLKRFDPDEPTPVQAPIPRRDPHAFQARLWVTRAHLWVDRLASAWLIQRFIDPLARFLWLAPGQMAPDGAVGFDFDGAEFSHVADRITFQTLLAAFDLETRPALMALGRMVYALDVGGPHPEAGGAEALLKGMRARIPDDDALFAACIPIFDDFHLFFSHEEHPDG